MIMSIACFIGMVFLIFWGGVFALAFFACCLNVDHKPTVSARVERVKRVEPTRNFYRTRNI